MPLVVAGLIRGAIQMAITLGFIEAAQWLLNGAIKTLMRLFGATEQQAIDVVANGWLQAAEAIGLGALAIKSRTPSKIADKLGFTSKGFAVRSSILGSGKLGALFGTGAKLTPQQVAVVAEETVAAIAKVKPSFFAKANTLVNFLLKTLAIPVGLGVVITNTLDFGAWSSSAYQEAFQKFFSIFGLEPDRDYVKSRVLSGEMFDKVYAVFQETGADYIVDPRTGQKRPFNRENLVDVADFVSAEAVLENGSVTTKQVLALLTALVVGGGKSSLQVAGDFKETTTPTPISTETKVFSTVISGGKITPSPVFTARPDDLIENLSELKTAAENNIATYLATVAGRVSYDISTVSSIITKDGFKQVGTTQKVISGYNKDGSAKYKTVTNKFAIAKLYWVKEEGSRTKIGEIVLGPTNAATLHPTTKELAELAETIHTNILTTDIAEISSIESEQNIQITAPQGDLGTGNNYAMPTSVGVADEVATSGIVATSSAGQNAQTLYEWYTANGQALPSVEQRSEIYQFYGLGQAAFYTGTAEQNTKLLAALKAAKKPATEAAKPPATASPVAGASTTSKQTWYNNGKNGTEKELYINDAYIQNRKLDAAVGALLQNPNKRNIPGSVVPDFYNGIITFEQLEAAIEASPDYDPNTGKLMNQGQGWVPFVPS